MYCFTSHIWDASISSRTQNFCQRLKLLCTFTSTLSWNDVWYTFLKKFECYLLQIKTLKCKLHIKIFECSIQFTKMYTIATFHLKYPNLRVKRLWNKSYKGPSVHGSRSEKVLSLCYYTLNSLSLFWLAKSAQWILEITAFDII